MHTHTDTEKVEHQNTGVSGSLGFVDVLELPCGDHRTSILYQLVSELPQVNRDTLAFLLLHLHK